MDMNYIILGGKLLKFFSILHKNFLLIDSNINKFFVCSKYKHDKSIARWAKTSSKK